MPVLWACACPLESLAKLPRFRVKISPLSQSSPRTGPSGRRGLCLATGLGHFRALIRSLCWGLCSHAVGTSGLQSNENQVLSFGVDGTCPRRKVPPCTCCVPARCGELGGRPWV